MVHVEVNEGILEGEAVNNEFGGTYYSFKGIPFAQPPVGDLRFKAPKPAIPWTGVRSAKEHGPICYQFDLLARAPPSGSEDCLYLNVYTPEINPNSPLPVMIFIHGGAFTSGSGNDDKYGPEFLVRQNIILVTINYRVEVLGFLCLDTEDVPGNAGMKDQVAALRWVKNNINNFGGDPDNITIFGESAGAASVTFHLISPMTKGLFRRAIAQSGTALCWWATAFQPRERARALARTLGLDTEDNKELYEFYKAQPVESLIQVNVPITFSEAAKESNDLQFGIVSEKKFGDNERYFYGDVFEALRNGIHEGTEVITGYCEHEGLIGLMNGVDVEKVVTQANTFLEFFVPRPIALKCSVDERLEVGRKMKQFYFQNKIVSCQNLEQVAKFYGMSLFVYGAMQWQKICAQNCGSNNYFYKFTCKSKRNVLGYIMGLGRIIGKDAVVCHADDLAYMFPMKILNQKLDKDSKEYKMIENVVKLWTNFAKYGNPTPNGSEVKWAPYTLEHQNYLDIGEELVPGTAPDREEVEFWEDIFRQYLPHSVA